MALKNQTKLLFAQQLEEMLKTTTMDKIRVVELCKRSGTIPQTFYYHFHDKYELVAWIFLYDFFQIYGNNRPRYSVASIVESLERMKERKLFYQRTFTENSQNSINDYIQKFNVKSATIAIENITGSKLSNEQLNEIKYHSYGSMGLFKEWLNDDAITIEQLANFQFQHTPEFLKVAYQNYSFTDKDFI